LSISYHYSTCSSSIFFLCFHNFLLYFPNLFTRQYWIKASWIVKRCEKYERKVSWILIRFGKYRRKVSWIVKRFGK
jgi:hypothetical protein